MEKKKRHKIICICFLAVAILAAAGISYYFFCRTKEPENMQGGVLVHERYTVYPDRQKC